jgi:hypothetical protein
VRQTTTINASMTAYSTAVGPSSEARNRLMLFVNVFIADCFRVFRFVELVPIPRNTSSQTHHTGEARDQQECLCRQVDIDASRARRPGCCELGFSWISGGLCTTYAFDTEATVSSQSAGRAIESRRAVRMQRLQGNCSPKMAVRPARATNGARKEKPCT